MISAAVAALQGSAAEDPGADSDHEGQGGSRPASGRSRRSRGSRGSRRRKGGKPPKGGAAEGLATAAELQKNEWSRDTDVLYYLSSKNVERVKEEFDTKAMELHRGLTMHEFVFVMLRCLGAFVLNQMDFVIQCIDLFKQVDVNGDDEMDWDEFTSYIVEAGMAQGHALTSAVPVRFEYRYMYSEDRNVHHSHVENVQRFGRPFNCIAALEHQGDMIRMFKPSSDASRAQLQQVKVLRHDTAYTPHQVQCFMRIPDAKVLVSSSSESTAGPFYVNFWDESKLTLLKRVRTRTPQTVMCWSTRVQTMYTSGHGVSAGTTGPICAWDVKTFAQTRSMVYHTSRVTAMMEIPGNMTNYLVSASEDGTLALWDIFTNSVLETHVLEAHECGVGGVRFSDRLNQLASWGLPGHVSAGKALATHRVLVWDTVAWTKAGYSHGHMRGRAPQSRVATAVGAGRRGSARAGAGLTDESRTGDGSDDQGGLALPDIPVVAGGPIQPSLAQPMSAKPSSLRSLTGFGEMGGVASLVGMAQDHLEDLAEHEAVPEGEFSEDHRTGSSPDTTASLLAKAHSQGDGLRASPPTIMEGSMLPDGTGAASAGAGAPGAIAPVPLSRNGLETSMSQRQLLRQVDPDHTSTDDDVEEWGDGASGPPRSAASRLAGAAAALRPDSSAAGRRRLQMPAPAVLIGHVNPIVDVVFQDDASVPGPPHLLSADAKGVIRVWNCQTFTCFQVLTVAYPIRRPQNSLALVDEYSRQKALRKAGMEPKAITDRDGGLAVSASFAAKEKAKLLRGGTERDKVTEAVIAAAAAATGVGGASGGGGGGGGGRRGTAVGRRYSRASHASRRGSRAGSEAGSVAGDDDGMGPQAVGGGNKYTRGIKARAGRRSSYVQIDVAEENTRDEMMKDMEAKLHQSTVQAAADVLIGAGDVSLASRARRRSSIDAAHSAVAVAQQKRRSSQQAQQRGGKDGGSSDDDADPDASETMGEGRDGHRYLTRLDVMLPLPPWATLAGKATVVLGGDGFRMMRLQQIVSSPIPLIAVMFSEQTYTFVTATSQRISVWDALCGRVLRSYEAAHICDGAELTSVCMDGRQRKLIAGDSAGRVRVLNILNCSVMKELDPHERLVSAVSFNEEDHCVVSTSWDAGMQVMDENDKDGFTVYPTHRSVLLRRVRLPPRLPSGLSDSESDISDSSDEDDDLDAQEIQFRRALKRQRKGKAAAAQAAKDHDDATLSARNRVPSARTGDMAMLSGRARLAPDATAFKSRTGTSSVDITNVVHCAHLNLMATSARGMKGSYLLLLWRYDKTDLAAACVPMDPYEEVHEYTGMAFVDPYSAMLTVDAGGYLTLWRVPPNYIGASQARRWTSPDPDASFVSLAVINAEADPDVDARYLGSDRKHPNVRGATSSAKKGVVVYTGDDKGFVHRWEVTHDCMLAHQIEPTKRVMRSTSVERRLGHERMPRHHITNAIARARRSKAAKAHPREFGACYEPGMAPMLRGTQPVWIGCWKAHNEAVTQLLYVKCNNTLVTASRDGLARVWTADGVMLGTLDPNPKNQPPPMLTWAERVEAEEKAARKKAAEDEMARQRAARVQTVQEAQIEIMRIHSRRSASRAASVGRPSTAGGSSVGSGGTGSPRKRPGTAGTSFSGGGRSEGGASGGAASGEDDDDDVEGDDGTFMTNPALTPVDATATAYASTGDPVEMGHAAGKAPERGLVTWHVRFDLVERRRRDLAEARKVLPMAKLLKAAKKWKKNATGPSADADGGGGGASHMFANLFGALGDDGGGGGAGALARRRSQASQASHASRRARRRSNVSAKGRRGSGVGVGGDGDSDAGSDASSADGLIDEEVLLQQQQDEAGEEDPLMEILAGLRDMEADVVVVTDEDRGPDRLGSLVGERKAEEARRVAETEAKAQAAAEAEARKVAQQEENARAREAHAVKRRRSFTQTMPGIAGGTMGDAAGAAAKAMSQTTGAATRGAGAATPGSPPMSMSSTGRGGSTALKPDASVGGASKSPSVGGGGGGFGGGGGSVAGEGKEAWASTPENDYLAGYDELGRREGARDGRGPRHGAAPPAYFGNYENMSALRSVLPPTALPTTSSRPPKQSSKPGLDTQGMPIGLDTNSALSMPSVTSLFAAGTNAMEAIAKAKLEIAMAEGRAPQIYRSTVAGKTPLRGHGVLRASKSAPALDQMTPLLRASASAAAGVNLARGALGDAGGAGEGPGSPGGGRFGVSSPVRTRTRGGTAPVPVSHVTGPGTRPKLPVSPLPLYKLQQGAPRGRALPQSVPDPTTHAAAAAAARQRRVGAALSGLSGAGGVAGAGMDAALEPLEEGVPISYAGGPRSPSPIAGRSGSASAGEVLRPGLVMFDRNPWSSVDASGTHYPHILSSLPVMRKAPKVKPRSGRHKNLPDRKPSIPAQRGKRAALIRKQAKEEKSAAARVVEARPGGKGMSKFGVALGV